MLTAKDLVNLFPALVTPFDESGGVDCVVMERLVARMFEGGAKGVVPLGGTGEYTALRPAERRQVVEHSVRAAEGKGPVVAGVLSPGFAEAVAAGRDFKAAGADAIMLLTPSTRLATNPALPPISAASATPSICQLCSTKSRPDECVAGARDYRQSFRGRHRDRHQVLQL